MTVADTFGLFGSSVSASYVETTTSGELVDKSRRLLLSIPRDRRLLVRDASMYNFYDLQLRVFCSASSVCRNVSLTMEHIRAAPEMLAVRLRTALNKPLIKVLGVDIDNIILGEPAPGLQRQGSPQLVPAVKLYGKTEEGVPATTTTIGAGLQTACVAGFASLMVLGALGWVACPAHWQRSSTGRGRR